MFLKCLNINVESLGNNLLIYPLYDLYLEQGRANKHDISETTSMESLYKFFYAVLHWTAVALNRLEIF